MEKFEHLVGKEELCKFEILIFDRVVVARNLINHSVFKGVLK